MKPDRTNRSPNQQQGSGASFGDGPPGFFAELWSFLKTNKKWWMIPILVALLLFTALILLSSTGLAPFIYTLF